MLKNTHSFFQIISISLLLGLSGCTSDNQETSVSLQQEYKFQPSDSQISLNNRGVGEMGYFEYDKASQTFQELVNSAPDWDLAKQNLAIALLNRQKTGDEEKSIEISQQLIAQTPDNIVAHYIVGILKFNQGDCETTLQSLQAVVQKDSQDAYALYFIGQCYLQNGDSQTALDYYQKAILANSYLRSAYYGAFMASQRLEFTDQATEYLEVYKKLDNNPKAVLAEIKYTRMGAKANAHPYPDDNGNKFELSEFNPPFFLSKNQLNIDSSKTIQTFGFVNLNRNAKTQLYVVLDNTLKIYDNFITNPKELETLTTNLQTNAENLAWGDINNDNKIDFYATGLKDQLYLQTDSGFEKVNMNDTGMLGFQSKAVRFIDADHDGDLDILLLNTEGQFEIWNNNLNATFTALSGQTNLANGSGFQQIYAHDVDNDRDTDIVLLSENKISILLNDRMWDYQYIESEIFSNSIKGLTFADNDVDGVLEISVSDEAGQVYVLQFDQGKIKRTGEFDTKLKSPIMVSADVNGNSQKEILLADNQSINIINHAGNVVEQISVDNISDFKVFNTINGAEIIALTNNQLWHIPASDNRGNFMLLNFSGKEDQANSVRSNYSGIGTSFTLRSGSFYTSGDSFFNQSGTSQDYQPISIAGGMKLSIDYLDMEWSDGVYQSEIGLEVGMFHAITETQRQLSSCPVIFVKNNGKYEFVSDVLGVGGIGFALGRHQYGEPRPWENYLLNDGQISSENGYFKVQFTEPMEESAYLDSMKLEVIDVPESYSVVLDERMVVSEPKASGNPLFYKELIRPYRALNKQGSEITSSIYSTDKVAAEIINNDQRFLGLVDEQIITLDFSNELFGGYHLLMSGWVEYGYSQTMFAAWQAGKVAQAPTIEYFHDGQWKTILSQFGYPAGMPRVATVPLNIPEKTNKIRIRTNMEIYFDELALFQSKQANDVVSHKLRLTDARLFQLGYPKRTDNEQRVPSYDMNNVQPFWDTRYMKGAYTRLGDVNELVQNKDNALAIIGAGESIELSFKDELPELQEGFKRYFLLKFHGWAKDMDILTHNGETLEPIPSSGNVSAKSKKLNQKYNTRYQSGR